MVSCKAYLLSFGAGYSSCGCEVKIKAAQAFPMGNFVAGVQHLRMLQASFGKDEHGLRERDISHKDKQNFNAVLNIIRASPLLDNIPDAKATKYFINLIQNVIDSYLDKMLSPTERLEKLWYTVFYLRYSRQFIHSILWRISLPTMHIICIELNAHALPEITLMEILHSLLLALSHVKKSSDLLGV